MASSSSKQAAGRGGKRGRKSPKTTECPKRSAPTGSTPLDIAKGAHCKPQVGRWVSRWGGGANGPNGPNGPNVHPDEPNEPHLKDKQLGPTTIKLDRYLT